MPDLPTFPTSCVSQDAAWLTAQYETPRRLLGVLDELSNADRATLTNTTLENLEQRASPLALSPDYVLDIIKCYNVGVTKFRLDFQALERDLQRQAQQLIQDKVDDIVSGQYCPRHGEFAKVTIKDEHVVADGHLAFSYSCCCAELRAAVDKALQDIGVS